MKKSILMILTAFALFLFIDDVSAAAINCDTKIAIGNSQVTLRIREEKGSSSGTTGQTTIKKTISVISESDTKLDKKSGGYYRINGSNGTEYKIYIPKVTETRIPESEVGDYLKGKNHKCDSISMSTITSGSQVSIHLNTNGTGKKLTTFKGFDGDKETSPNQKPSKPSSGKKPSGSDSPTNGDCETWLGSKTVEWLKKIFGIIQIAAPILVVVLTMVDFVGVVISSEDGAMKKAWGKFVKRAVVAIALILLPILVNLILDIGGVDGHGTCGIE